MAGVASWNKSPGTSAGYTFSSFGLRVFFVFVVNARSPLIGKSQSSLCSKCRRSLEYFAGPVMELPEYGQLHQPDAVSGLISQRSPQYFVRRGYPITRTNLPRLPSQPSNSLMTMARSPCLQRAICISFLAASPRWRGQQYGTNPPCAVSRPIFLKRRVSLC